LGDGIVTDDGGDPIDHWRARINYLDCPRQTQLLTRLLTGREVFIEGTDEQVDWTQAAEYGVISVRLAGCPLVVDLVVVPANKNSPIKKFDSREPHPLPDAWRQQLNDSTVRWELFNCVVKHYRLRRNSP